MTVLGAVDSDGKSVLRCNPRAVSFTPIRACRRGLDNVQMQAKQLWQAVLTDMERRLSRNAFDNWLRPSTIVGFEDDVATIGAANTFNASTLKTRYGAEIERVLSEIVGRPIRV